MANEYNSQNNYDQQPYYNHNGYYYGAYPPPQRDNPLGIVSLVLGITSVVMAVVFSCCAPGTNMPFAIAAIILGIFQLNSKTNQNGRGKGMAGLICGIVSTGIFLLIILLYVAFCVLDIFTNTEMGDFLTQYAAQQA
ncbi:hypothetical protein SAMN02910353_00765 [Ruminococcus sp. YRD2003]|uniref:DUF4190 domain-containing protein n=1 Tax=Ruminococcus sp. YRD2003 TaxID=1452313 RepID=UPI0008CFDAD8|nr:hypothetical protein SAMN02910353_00765 [Ruminococcus flavefaciens]